MTKRTKAFRRALYRYRAILFILSLALISIIGVLQLFSIAGRNNVKLLTRSHLDAARKAYTDLEANTGNMLSATLEALVKNKEYTRLYLAGERDKLYDTVFPTFRYLKENNNITHWYFVDAEPDKTCFLRVHYPKKYGDVITRATMETCIKTKQIVFGKELGKTALALRGVRPYYHDNRLIGYMELAVELEDFLQLLKNQTGNDYSLLVQKKYLDESKWASVTSRKHEENSWNTLNPFLLVAHTTNLSYASRLYGSNLQVETIPDEGLELDKIEQIGRHFTRGIFPFRDAEGRKVGAIFTRKEITSMVHAMQSRERQIILMIVLFMGVITFFMVFFHKRAERELKRYRNQLEEMVSARTAEQEETNRLLNLEIDEHKRAEEALKAECIAREDAEQKRIEAVKHAARSTRMASIGVMAAGITHEINQPLNAIKVTADSIRFWNQRNPGRLPDIFVDQLSLITESVNRIVEIIQHMRAFWVVPDAPRISHIDINQAVTNALSLTRQQMHKHEITHRFHSTNSALIIDANLIHIEQIIVNILVNAIHALDEVNRDQKSISLITRRDVEQAILEISDNGPGLASLDTDKLFDPFFSTHTEGGGTGLGLAIVKRYIDRYNGTVQVNNNADYGARFTISFPISKQKGGNYENPAN
ncbi:MAG: GHKL domain-containing protein [bacterium]|nr:GHKL domain-containing protein [bacterium]